MAQTATEAAETYKRLTAAYVQLVKDQKKWSNSDLARLTDLDRSTVSRAVNGVKKTDFHRLLTIERVSGVEMPAALRAAYEALSHQPAKRKGDTFDDMVAALHDWIDRDPDALARALKEIRKAK